MEKNFDRLLALTQNYLIGEFVPNVQLLLTKLFLFLIYFLLRPHGVLMKNKLFIDYCVPKKKVQLNLY